VPTPSPLGPAMPAMPRPIDLRDHRFKVTKGLLATGHDPATTVAMVTASTAWLLHDGNDEGFKTVLEINVLIAALAQEANGIDRCSEIASLGTWGHGVQHYGMLAEQGGSDLLVLVPPCGERLTHPIPHPRCPALRWSLRS